MEKAVIITDMPKNCLQCRWLSETKNSYEERYCILQAQRWVHPESYKISFYKLDQINKDCPLLKLPDPEKTDVGIEEIDLIYKCGWNDCLKAIEGGKGNE